ncbi:MAG: ParB N-terminal domain-containing protein [Desulfobacterales bacterium]|nr:ParB N-terminal domain-containing protein [Desulfobacterales bacterium]
MDNDMNIVDVSINEITEIISPREKPDKNRINFFSKLMDSGEIFDPVSVVKNENGYTLYSGHHRLESHKKLKKLTIKAKIRDIPKNEILLHATAKNMKSIKPMKNEEIDNVILHYFNLNMPLKKISEKGNIPYHYVMRIVKPFKRAKELNNKKQILSLKNQNKNIAEICKITGFGRTLVRSFISKSDISDKAKQSLESLFDIYKKNDERNIIKILIYIGDYNTLNTINYTVQVSLKEIKDICLGYLIILKNIKYLDKILFLKKNEIQFLFNLYDNWKNILADEESLKHFIENYLIPKYGNDDQSINFALSLKKLKFDKTTIKNKSNKEILKKTEHFLSNFLEFTENIPKTNLEKKEALELLSSVNEIQIKTNETIKYLSKFT